MKRLSSVQKNKSYKIIYFIAVILLIASLILIKFPVWRIAVPYSSFKYFDKKEIAELLYSGSAGDRNKVESIMKTADDAFSSLEENNKTSEEKYGLLSRYAYDKSSYPEAVRTDYELELLSAECSGNDGYMWVKYSQEALDKNSDIVSGSWNILSRWEIKKDKNGDWYVSDISEAP